jgi:hypothetical protein
MTNLMTDSLLPEHNRLARLLRLARTGDPASVYEQARDGLARAGDECARAEWADCLSDCCLKLLRYEEALGYSKQAAAIWETQRNMPRLARSLSRMAEFLSDLGAPWRRRSCWPPCGRLRMATGWGCGRPSPGP